MFQKLKTVTPEGQDASVLPFHSLLEPARVVSPVVYHKKGARKIPDPVRNVYTHPQRWPQVFALDKYCLIKYMASDAAFQFIR